MPLGIPHSKFLSWAEDDQDKALAFLRDQREVCKGCGTRHSDWAENRFAFVANSVRCLGCETIELEREQIPPGEKGVYVGLIPQAQALAQEDGLVFDEDGGESLPTEEGML